MLLLPKSVFLLRDFFEILLSYIYTLVVKSFPSKSPSLMGTCIVVNIGMSLLLECISNWNMVVNIGMRLLLECISNWNMVVHIGMRLSLGCS